MKKRMQELIKNWPSILLVIAGICAAIATYVSTKRTDKQQTNIEELGEINKELGSKNQDLTNEVKKLSKLNISISEENKDLSIQSKILIEEVRKLTVSSNSLISRLDDKADKVIAENLITGELKMDFDINTPGNQKPTIILGGGQFEDNGLPVLSIGGFIPLTTKYLNKKLLISMKVYDLAGNLIAELEDNNWRPNKNFTGKYNYDRRGFEVINNQGNIAASFDIVGPNTIKIQGFFPYMQTNKILIAGDKGFTTAPFGTKQIEERVFQLTNKKYDLFLKEKFSSVPTTQLFEYSGPNWLHKRKKN